MDIAKFDYLYYYTHQPSSEVPQHHHSCHELVYYLEGTGETNANGTVILYRPDTYCIYAAQTPHTEVHFIKTSVMCVGFKSSSFNNIKIKTGIYEDADHQILSVIDRIKQEVNSHLSHYNTMNDILLSELLIKHDRLQNKMDAKYDELQHIKQFINENISYDIDVVTLAELSGYSYHYFRHLFKLQTELSPKQYIIQKRIEYAQTLLVNSNMAVFDIAQACGFLNSSQFNVIFKKYVDISPLRYRQQARSSKVSEV